SQHIHLYTDPATTKNYTLSLHDALPICKKGDVQKDAREHQSRWGVADVQTNNKHAQGESHSATRRHQDGSTSPSIKKDHRENREDKIHRADDHVRRQCRTRGLPWKVLARDDGAVIEHGIN